MTRKCTRDYHTRKLIHQNKELAQEGIGIHNPGHNPQESNPEYEEFLKKYEKITSL